jgi:hypothetical protein
MVTCVYGVLNTGAIVMDRHQIKLTVGRKEEERARDERK